MSGLHLDRAAPRPSSRRSVLSGSIRLAFCLGMTLLVLICGAAFFLTGSPGGGDGIPARDGPPEDRGTADRNGGASRAGPAGSPGATGTSLDGTADVSAASVHGGESDPAFGDAASAGAIADASRADRAASAAAEAVLPSLGPGTGGRLPAGRLYDGATGQGLAGARILATGFHGTEDPRTAGTPARFQAEVEAGGDGSFEIPLFDADDPRLLVHLQIDHPDYLPSTAVLRRRETLLAEWQRKEIPLRRGFTSRVRIVANGKPLARAAVDVTAMVSSHALLEKEASVAFPGSCRLITPAEPRVFYTDTDGDLRLPDSDYPHLLKLLHPFYRLFWRDPYLDRTYEGEIRYRAPASGEGTVTTLADVPYTLAVEDRDGAPIANSEVEASLKYGPVRLLTDDSGRLTVGHDPSATISKPDVVTLTLLTPAFFKRGATVGLPNEDAEAIVPWSPARRLIFRATNDEEEPQPVTPEGVRVMSSGLTLTRRSSSGEVECRGEPPPEGESLEIHLRGFLPREVRIRPFTDLTDTVDLGDVSFDEGLSMDIELQGIERSLLEEATLMVSPVDRPDHTQRYPVRGAERLKVSGLEVGTYDLGVEGPYLRKYMRTFEAEADPDEPVRAELGQSDEESLVVRGHVVGADAEKMTRLTVIERYFVAGLSEPVVAEIYRPAPDGTIGSVRRSSRTNPPCTSVLVL